MANYTNLDNPSVNITRLIKEQNDAGWTAGSFSGKEPFEVLISKSTFSLKQQIDAFIKDAFPSLTGNSGKVLTNNGTVASWTGSPSLSSLSVSGATTVGSLVTSVITGSPTISGNLTVNGTGTSTVARDLDVGSSSSNTYTVRAKGNAGTNQVGIGGGTYAKVQGFTNAFVATDIQINPAGGTIYLGLSGSNISEAGNLTVSGTGNQVIGGAASRLVLQGGTAVTPASAAASGTAGSVVWDASYIYVCTATNTWKRAAIATW